MNVLLLKWIDNNLDYDITGETKDIKSLFVEIALENSSFRNVLEESTKQVKFIRKLKNAIELEDALHQAKTLINRKE